MFLSSLVTHISTSWALTVCHRSAQQNERSCITAGNVKEYEASKPKSSFIIGQMQVNQRSKQKSLAVLKKCHCWSEAMLVHNKHQMPTAK
jgi:hypothetical protein